MIKRVQLKKGKYRDVDETHCKHKRRWIEINHGEVSNLYQAYCDICKEKKTAYMEKFNF
jgi:hypothetical protein